MSVVIRVDMSTGTIVREEAPEAKLLLGGRGLTSEVISREVPPTCDPLGPENKLVFAPGFLCASSAPCANRLSVGCKSPLTGTIKESNSGGTAALKMGRLGIRAIVVEGAAPAGELHLLHVSRQGVRLLPAAPYAGMDNYDLVAALKKEFGDKSSIVSIGTAGERKLLASTIAVTDPEGTPSRHAARGGPGAVMGSKGLKAILIDDAGAKPRAAVDPAAFKAAREKVVRGLRENPATSVGLTMIGTGMLMNVINEVGALPTRNFRTGQWDKANNVSGEQLYTNVVSRPGAKSGHACTPGCIIRCSNIYTDEEGEYVTSGLEFETMWSFGPNCEIDDLDAIAKIDYACDNLGVDTVDVGVAVGVAMEAGHIAFGDAEGAARLVREIGQGSEIGIAIGSGAVATGKKLNVERVAAVKGQALSAYDPRGLKGMGVTYATSPMGADHTAGYAVAQNALHIGGFVEPLGIEGQRENSLLMQYATAFLDASGQCIFTAMALLDNHEMEEGMIEMVNAYCGASLTREGMIRYGRELVEKEIAFNRAAGFTEREDTLPAFFREEPLLPHGTVYDVP